MALSARDQKEKDDLDKLDDLRKSYLAKKGKKPTPKNIKVDSRSAREKKDAADYKKLEVLRKRYLTNVKKSVRPKAKKINSVKEIDTVIKEIKKPTISIAVVTVEPKQRTVKTRAGKTDVTDLGKQRTVKTRAGKTNVTGPGKQRTVKTRAGKKKRKIPEGRSINMKVPKSVSKRKIPEGRSTNMKVPKSVSKMSLAEKKGYFNVVNKERPRVKREIKKSSAGTFVTYPQFTLAEYLKLSKHDRYLMGLPETDERLSRNSRNILTFTKIKN